MLQKIEFRFSRGDWVALSTAVAKRPLGFRLMTVSAAVSVMLVVMSFLSGSGAGGGSMLADALRGGNEWYPMFALFAVLSAALLFRHRVIGFNAAASFGRMPLADKTLTVELGETEVHTTSEGLDWRFPWAAVSRVIETPRHLVLATGGREGLPIPHRAFADAAEFEAVRSFIFQHLPEEAVHDRA